MPSEGDFKWPDRWECARPLIEDRVSAVSYFCRRRIPHDVGELLSDVMYEVVKMANQQEANKFPKAADLVQYAGRIAWNKLKERLRRRRAVEGVDLSKVPAPGDPPGEPDELEAILELLQDPKEREVLRLHYREELSYSDVAKRIGKSVGTVANILRRAKEKLRGRLDR